MKADIIVIGAGLAGSALAYYLSEGGARVVLLDKDYPGLGASGRSAGLLTVQQWNRLDVGLSRESQEICTRLTREREGGMRKVGFLRATSQDEDIPLMRERVRMYNGEGIEARFLEGNELSSLFTSIDASNLLAGIFTPQDGYVDAYDVTSSFFAGAKEGGVVAKMGSQVNGIQLTSSRVAGVRTPEGSLSAETVVMAAGAWSAVLLRHSGIPLPLKPYRAQALVTAPIEDMPVLPMFHELPSGFYLRPDRDGLLLGDGTEDSEANPESYNTHADFGLYSDIATWMLNRVPTLKEVKIARGWAGLCVSTPDRFPLVGQVDGIEGLYVLVGFNGLGVMRAPPLARYLAKELTERRPIVDLAPLSPDRFEGTQEFPILEGFTLQDTLGLSKAEPSKEGD